jgi:FkbM family methyltransferase
MSSTDTPPGGKGASWGVRETFFEEAARFTPLLGVDTKYGRFVVSTSDHMVGKGLFTKQLRPEMSTLRRVTRILVAEGVLPSPERRTFVDVGANIGTSTVAALREGFARGVAVEPAPENLALLRQNMALNDLADRVEILAIAASDAEGTVRLALSEENWGDHRVVAGDGDLGRSKVVEVRAAPLDALVAAGQLRPEEIGLLWVDVQGHEGQVLAGASSVLAAGAGVVTELWPEGLEANGGTAAFLAAVQQHFAAFIDMRERDEADKNAYETRSVATIESFLREMTDHHTDLLLLPRQRPAGRTMEKDRKGASSGAPLRILADAVAPRVKALKGEDRLDRRLRRARKQPEPMAQLRKDLARTHKVLERMDRTVSRRVVGGLESLERDVAAVQRRLAIDASTLPYPERLLAHRFRLHSQNEEDGVLLALLEAAGVGPRRFVEIGCGDNGGNSGMLAGELGFDGLMVDGAESNVAACRLQFPRATVEQAWIERETVDELVTSRGFGGELDLLSVDIDGNDLYVWDALTSVQPRIAIAEYNSLMGPDSSVTIGYDPDFVLRQVEGADGGYFGASLTALTRSMAKRGMRLVTTDFRGVNAFFLREDLAPQIPAVEPARVFRVLEKHQRMIDHGYDLVRVCEERGLELVPYE